MLGWTRCWPNPVPGKSRMPAAGQQTRASGSTAGSSRKDQGLVEGECETCGRWASDLIDVMCGDCRSRYLGES